MPHTPPSESIVALLTELVRIPSRGGIDSYSPVLSSLARWLAARRVPHEVLDDAQGAPIAICGRIDGTRPGPCYLLNATVDTAPFADDEKWTQRPLSAALIDGWLYGRGSGDSKAGVAIFCHVLAELRRESERWSGSLAYAFDAAEHTGEFTGIRRFMETRATQGVAGAFIGYPNNNRIAVGGRGFLRARIRVHGRAAHTGSSSRPGVNAIWRAARLVERIQQTELPHSDAFPLPPRVTVTAVEGGHGFSVVPDACTLGVDMRLTTTFDREAARAHLQRLVAVADRESPDVAPTTFEWFEGWPPFRLDPSTDIVVALREAAREVLGRSLPEEVVGPSSVANYLHTLGVPATNGFGVTCENAHGVDERIAVDSIAPVYEVYCRALRRLLQR